MKIAPAVTHQYPSSYRVVRTNASASDAVPAKATIPFEYGDVDHVAIRPGLVVAVETEWANTSWLVRESQLSAGGDVLVQARTGAAKIRLLLGSTVGEVHAVVAVWGKGGEALDRDVAFVDGVWVVRGRTVAHIDTWLDVFDSALPTASEVSACIRVIEEFVRVRDAHEARLANAVPAASGTA